MLAGRLFLARAESRQRGEKTYPEMAGVPLLEQVPDAMVPVGANV